MESTAKTRDVFSLVTNRVIELLEQGTVPWKKPWAEAGLPRNLITGKPYRGINVWLLSTLNYQYNFFLTFNQAQELGASVRAGEKGHLVVFWKMEEPKNETLVNTGAAKNKAPFLRYYFVFNISQIANLPDECIPLEQFERKNDPIEMCEEIVARMPQAPEVRHMGDEAYYHPFFDFVNMPSMGKFFNSESYYQTLFHELIHSTGHLSRLNRKELQIATPNAFEAYSIEELTAEMGACFLSSYAGIDGWDFTNHVAYIDTWLKRLRSDKKCIVYASAQAQRGADYILNTKFSNEVGFAETEFFKTVAL